MDLSASFDGIDVEQVNCGSRGRVKWKMEMVF